MPPLSQQLGPAYAKEHPDSALTYREWGFERLRDYLATIESTVAVSPDGSGRGFVVTVNLLLPAPIPPPQPTMCTSCTTFAIQQCWTPLDCPRSGVDFTHRVCLILF